MEFIFGVAGIAFAVWLFWTTLVLPWKNSKAVKELHEEIQRLKALLLSGASLSPEEIAALEKPAEKPVEKLPEPAEKTAVAAMDIKPEKRIAKEEKKEEEKPAPAKEKKKEEPKKAQDRAGWEQQFGAKLPVWMGGIAIAFAGIFFVKYSIEHGLLSPSIRVILGIVSGVALLWVARFLREKKPDLANGERITQSLSGAGIIVLYASIFAAASLYSLIPPLLGFVGMAAVTMAAVLLSLKYGAAIALLGLVGGFATPALVSTGNASAAGLFVYLFFVFTGLMIVMRRQGWWLLSLLAVGAGFLWVFVWMAFMFHAGDGIWLALFLAGIAGVSVMTAWNIPAAEKKDGEEKKGIFSFAAQPEKIVNYAGLGGAALLMAAVLDRADYGILEWGMFWLLAAGTLVLAWGRPHLYKGASYVSLGLSLLMFLNWHNPPQDMLAPLLSLFALLFCGFSAVILFRVPQKLFWSRMLTIAAFGYFWTGYKLLYLDISARTVSEWVWGGGALVLGTLAVFVLERLQNIVGEDDAELPKLQAVYALATVGFISLGASIVLEMKWWGLVLVAEVLALLWMNNRLAVASLSRLAKILTALFVLSIMPLILLSIGMMVFGVTGQDLQEFSDGKKYIELPLLRIGLPGLLLVAGGYFYRQTQKAETGFVKFLEVFGLIIFSAAAYFALRTVLYSGSDILAITAGFAERGIGTMLFFALAFLFLAAGGKWERSAYKLAALWVGWFAVLRVVYFDLIVMNPYWADQSIFGTKIFNTLWLNYVAAGLAIWFFRREIMKIGVRRGTGFLNKIMLLLGIAFVTLQVRHFYHGADLSGGGASNAEIYTYSAVWLLTGFAALGVGVIRNNAMLRYASLAIVTLTVGKVFLYDASALEGLYRVFSFFGLGVSLIALSWFYTRFVFQKQDAEKLAAEQEKK
ncbi:MAG: DUF2339 domain-containing protein [Pseudomonadota bacterium]|nr:DUF2339 domain-containing protein [Pseudomonadota bacterium]QKK04946.1 MAG: DUF2339 domain-containing protein [Pseudomonadota bacterium]